jgi:hypothetical protein
MFIVVKVTNFYFSITALKGTRFSQSFGANRKRFTTSALLALHTNS